MNSDINKKNTDQISADNKHSKIGKASIILTCISTSYIVINWVTNGTLLTLGELDSFFVQIVALIIIQILGIVLGIIAMFQKGTCKIGPMCAIVINLGMIVYAVYIIIIIGVGIVTIFNFFIEMLRGIG